MAKKTRIINCVSVVVDTGSATMTSTDDKSVKTYFDNALPLTGVRATIQAQLHSLSNFNNSVGDRVDFGMFSIASGTDGAYNGGNSMKIVSIKAGHCTLRCFVNVVPRYIQLNTYMNIPRSNYGTQNTYY